MEPTIVSGSSGVQAQRASIIKKDILVAIVIGFLIGILAIPIIKQIKPEIFKVAYLIAIVLVLPILSAAGMFVALILAQKIRVIYQLAKFVLVGGLNTFVDWGVLNLALFLMGADSGMLYNVAKGISFIVANVNSYFWNKHFTFKKPQTTTSPAPDKEASKEILQFFIVSVIGFVINLSIAGFIVNIFGPHFGVSKTAWATVGAACGTVIGLVWNFLGYKLVVFKK